MKIDAGDKRLLMLIRKEKLPDGWAPVSDVVMPLIEALSSELVEIRRVGVGGFCRLTEKGEIVLDWC